jgi:hypothetical protein
MTFQPGESGNPAGRPRGARNKKTLLLEALLRKVIGMGKRSGDPGLRRLIERTLAPRKPIPARRGRQPLRHSSPVRSSAKRHAALQCSKRGGGACKYQRKYKRGTRRRCGKARAEKRGAG